MPHGEILVRNNGMAIVGQIDRYASLQATLDFNDVGSWKLDVSRDHRYAAALMADQAGIVVTKEDGTTLFSGPIWSRIQRWESGKDERLIVSGPTDTYAVARRLALPVPGGPPYTSQSHDARTGPAETVLKGYVQANCITNRTVTGLSLEADQARGDTVTEQSRFDELLELLRAVALAGGGLGFQVVQVGTDLEFQVYEPTDRTATAVFGRDEGNLIAYEHKEDGPDANYLYIAGGGEGTARSIVEGGDSSSIVRWGRVEGFRDARDTSDSTILAQRRDEDLERRKEQTRLSITPVDVPNRTFGVDYALGDRVTVVVRSAEISDVVRQVRLNLTPEQGEQITPVVGTPESLGASLVTRLEHTMRDVGLRLRNLERS